MELVVADVFELELELELEPMLLPIVVDVVLVVVVLDETFPAASQSTVSVPELLNAELAVPFR